ncbi:MAG: glycoside hydrolase family 3 N-terminal domain-containing protein [Pseudomonadota bacterium]|nr:glycoside hydrolase family 3 N-terminal domain-containing protein [Pseudomonadota bacterium]
MKRISFRYIDVVKILSSIIYNLPSLIVIKLRLFFKSGTPVRVITKDNDEYRDLNGNGHIDLYEDHNVSSSERAEDLLSKMTLEEKAGQMFHPPISLQGGLISKIMNLASGKADSTESLILEKHISHFNLYGSPNPLELAEKLNFLQNTSEKTRLGIPLTISSDPIHEVPRGGGIAAFSLKGFSKWPSQLGFASIRDPKIIKEFSEIASKEYLAVGIRTALHPMSDLATDPRWARNFGTFGSNADLSSDLTKAYMEGFQGNVINNESVMTMVKHFPGGGPQEDGLDPHLYSGRNQVYPGDNFDYHLKPFKAAIDNGLKVIMPYYGIPVDQTRENVAMAYNKDILTNLLRKEMGFEGVICTDWGIISGRHWGVDELSIKERYKKSILAGVDQYGGESSPEYIINLVREGVISEERIDYSVKKILINKFELGLFDDPFVDESNVDTVVGIESHVVKGLEAQRKSIVLLNNRITEGKAMLPIKKMNRIFSDGFNVEILERYCEIVQKPEDADYILLQLGTVFNGNQPSGIDRPIDNFLSSMFPNSDLNFNEEILSKVRKYASIGNLITVVDLNRPAILEEIDSLSQGLIGVFGVLDETVLDVVFGDFNPSGKLPFDIPSSMKEVEEQKSDVPDDTSNPSFKYGYGLSYSENKITDD